MGTELDSERQPTRGREIPWLRVLLEGAVILTSILLAFAVDAAWDVRQERSLERQVVAAIERDMRANRAMLGDFTVSAEATSDRMGRFLESTGEELGTMPEDSVAAFLITLYTASTFQPVYGSLSASNLTLVSDLDLRNELSSWLGSVEDLQETAPYEIDSSFELMEHAGAIGALLSAGPLVGLATEGLPAQAALERVRNDEPFVNAAFRNLTIRAIGLAKLRRLAASTDRVLDLLDR